MRVKGPSHTIHPFLLSPLSNIHAYPPCKALSWHLDYAIIMKRDCAKQAILNLTPHKLTHKLLDKRVVKAETIPSLVTVEAVQNR